MNCIVLEAFSLSTQGFEHRAEYLGARPGSLDRGKRTLPGQRGRIDKNNGAQAEQESQCKAESLLGSRKVSGQEKTSYKGGTSQRKAEASGRAGRQPSPRENLLYRGASQGQRTRWEAADSGRKKVPLPTPSLVNSGRHSVR